jgi:hypothetical protein
MSESIGAGIMCAHERSLSLSAMCVPRTQHQILLCVVPPSAAAAAGSTHARSFSRKPSARGFDVYEMRVAWPARVVKLLSIKWGL